MPALPEAEDEHGATRLSQVGAQNAAELLQNEMPSMLHRTCWMDEYVLCILQRVTHGWLDNDFMYARGDMQNTGCKLELLCIQSRQQGSKVPHAMSGILGGVHVDVTLCLCMRWRRAWRDLQQH